MNPTIDPEKTPGLYRIATLSDRLKSLMDDPQPGFQAWMFSLSSTLEELAVYCGTEVAVYAGKVREQRESIDA